MCMIICVIPCCDKFSFFYLYCTPHFVLLVLSKGEEYENFLMRRVGEEQFKVSVVKIEEEKRS